MNDVVTVRFPSHDDLVAFAKSMRAAGALEFSHGNFSVKFDPHFRETQPLTDADLDDDGELQVKRDPKLEAQRIKRAQIEAEEDLFYST